MCTDLLFNQFWDFDAFKPLEPSAKRHTYSYVEKIGNYVEITSRPSSMPSATTIAKKKMRSADKPAHAHSTYAVLTLIVIMYF